MKKATENVIASLAKAGCRITKARKQIIETLAASATPLTISELAKQVSVDEASVYRTIATLLEKEMVEEILIKGERSRFALVHGHHHHAVCRGCGVIAHVPCDQQIKTPTLSTFASLDEHEVTFYGLCSQCV